MARAIAVGEQDFVKIRENDYFYIDKTPFIKEWWESGDSVTLITRPRRFGKTLNMSMLEHFFSIKYAEEEKIFENLIYDKELISRIHRELLNLNNKKITIVMHKHKNKAPMVYV